MKTIIYFLNFMGCILLFLCMGCNKKPTIDTDETPVITLKSIEASIMDTAFLKNPQVVLLETNDSSLITDMWRCKIGYDDESYFILDKDKAEMLIFDKNGKFINAINRKGLGPMEYIELTDFTLDTINKQIIILCTIPEKIMYFSYSGDFIKEEKNRTFYCRISLNNRHLFFEKSGYQEGMGTTFQIDVKNTVDDSYQSVLPIIKGIGKENDAHSNGDVFTEGASDNFYARRFDNTIYQFINGSVEKKYKIDFHKYWIPEKLKEKDSDTFFEYRNNHDLIFAMSNIVESENLLLFFTDRVIFIYDKEQKQLIGYREIINSLDKHLSTNFYLPIKKTNKIAFNLSFLNDLDFLKKISNIFPEGYEVKYDDNPILLVFDLK